MCFSAGASFGAAAIIGAVGVISLKNISKSSDLMFAAIPVLFSLQQISEGFLWLTLSGKNSLWQTYTTFIFLFFAQILWSTWIPLSMFFLETHKTRKKILGAISLIGFLCSALLGYRLIFYDAFAQIMDHRIYYKIESPEIIRIVSSILYFIATIFPAFISGIRKMKILGILLAFSLLFSLLFYKDYLISVWCFFAAFLSIVVLFILKTRQKDQLQKADAIC